MRYLGNKARLTGFIEAVIDKYEIKGDTFADLFSGTSSVGDYFKDRYKIISNDYMYFSKIISDAKILNNSIPDFESFIEKYDISPFDYLNKKEYEPKKSYFVYKNYTPVGDRMYITEENALKIDGMRLDIEEFYKEEIVDYKEYAFLLASLLGSVLKVSNTTGTYQAFLKFWESRALKDLILEPLELKETEDLRDNITYCENTNELVRKIEGDIAYIDPPYTINQYTNSYHVLETIAKYDYPEIFGITGRRKSREFSKYSNKTNAIHAFEDLFRQINFDHVLISYSTQSILTIEELTELASKFAIDGVVHVERLAYREYSTNNSSMKGNGNSLKECIIYFRKDRSIKKSPLNYSGSKDNVVDRIFKHLPYHVPVFVDVMGGAFNIGANVFAMDKVVYNEFNPFVYSIMEMINNTEPQKLVEQVERVVSDFSLKKKDKENYLKLRTHYNEVEKTSLNLFILQIYAFQNIIRFNNSFGMNTPVGNNEYCDSIRDRILEFKPKVENVELLNLSYSDINIDNYPEDTVFYFDPPYFITRAEYNDGRRGFIGWNAEEESALLDYLNDLNKKGYKFMLSNVLEHNGKKHHMLNDWIKSHGYNVYSIGETGIKYPRKEVLITNY